MSICVYSWLFSSFNAVAIVWFVDDGIIGGFAKNYNSSPVIHLAAALPDLTIISRLYGRVIVPFEVLAELESGSERDDR